MTYTFPTQDAAVAELGAQGWTPRPSGYWAKMSANVVDDRPQLALVAIVHHRVDPALGADYHEIRFL